jgi:hypothetical protein
MLEACGRYIQFCSGNMKGGDHLGDDDINRRIILKMGLTVWTGFIWGMTGTNGALL